MKDISRTRKEEPRYRMVTQMQNKKIIAYLIVSFMIFGAFPMVTCVVSADTGSRLDDGDGTFATANVITSNDYTTHDTLKGDTDTYEFFKIQLNNSGTSPGNAEKIIVNATSDGTQGQSIRLNIYDPTQYWIMSDLSLGKTSYLQLLAPCSGWFYVSVEGQGTVFPYGIRIQKTTVPWTGDLHNEPATATVVSSFPYTVTGSFANQSDPQDFYKVHLEKVAGDHTDLLMAKLTPPTGGPLVVPEVYYASNNTGVPNWFNQQGASWITAPMGNIFTFAPPVTADYLIRVWGYQGTGNYDLKMNKVRSTVDTNTDMASAVSILGPAKKHADSVMGEVAYGMDTFDYFKFTGKSGMHINATLYSATYDANMMLPVLYLHIMNETIEYAEADMIVLRQTADPHAVIEGILPQNDTYYIFVESQGGAGQYVLNITANTPPQIIAPLKDEMFIWENGTNSSLTLSTVFADFDGDPMTYTSDTNTHMDVTINPTTTVVTFAPKPSFKGIACINLTATDSEGDSGTYKVCPNTHGINHAPYIKKQFNQTYTDGILIMKVNDVVANITLADYFGDPDVLDHHWYNFTGYNENNVWISVGKELPETPDHFHTGLLTILGKGKEATEHVTFYAKDNGYPKLASPALNLTIMLITGEVKMWNKNGGEIKINEDNTTTFPVKEYIYFKPPAPKDDTVAFTYEVPTAMQVEVSITAGIATFTPAKDWCGSGVIKFTGTGVKNTKATNTTAVKLTVVCINDPPVITDWTPKANLTVAEGGTLQFKVVATDVDTAVNLIRYKWIIDGAQMGSVVNSLNYTPNFEMAGIHNVTVFVNDSQVQVSYKWANVTVTNVNRPPSATTVKINEPKANTTFTKGKAVTFQAGTASDPDKDTMIYSWYDNGVKIGETQTITYKFTKKGAHEVKLVVTDGKGGSTESLVKVNVKDPKKTPGFDGVALLLGVIVAVSIVAILGRRYNK
jgi:hypothetical protein